MSLEDDVTKLENQLKTFRISSNRPVLYPKFVAHAGNIESRVNKIEQYIQKLTFKGDFKSGGDISEGFTVESAN